MSDMKDMMRNSMAMNTKTYATLDTRKTTTDKSPGRNSPLRIDANNSREGLGGKKMNGLQSPTPVRSLKMAASKSNGNIGNMSQAKNK
jgi:hypothetical protein